MDERGGEVECEQAWVLVGKRRGRIWYGRRINRSSGEPATVDFNAAEVLEREERRRDVIGFLHTHPNTPARPSQRDLRTMRAWVGCFGKPLLCVIDGVDGLAAFRFDDDESTEVEMSDVESFPGGVVVAVD